MRQGALAHPPRRARRGFRRAGRLGGGLWQGGFKAVSNGAFLRAEAIGRIVSTARDLGAFFPKFRTYKRAARAGGAAVLELGWRA